MRREMSLKMEAISQTPLLSTITRLPGIQAHYTPAHLLMRLLSPCLINVNNLLMADEDNLQENIWHTLWELLNNHCAREKSQAQMLAIMMVLRWEQDAIIMIHTGGCKSMLWIISPLLDNSIHLIVVSPYSVLLDEQHQKAMDTRFRAASFRLDKHPPQDTQILFVQVEHVYQKSKFEKFLFGVEVVNFTHMIINKQYNHITCLEERKSAWCQLTQWTSWVNMSIILLSGTNLPSLQHQIQRTSAFGRITPLSSTALQLGLHIIHLDPFAGLVALAHLVSELAGKLTADERILVFFECCKLAESFVEEHGFAVYHSKLLNSEMKCVNLQFWDNGTSKVMACTSAFGFGVDCPNICFIIIFNLELSLLTMMQMAGWAGRDGRETHIFLATSE
ncbi:hypothetical protein JVT61DRAFT_14919 [Boletus reticuloceps]|uniref:DNA 3'-5' helicase n=1 Tax=Boletus reticuloceps TaxID=495285 RepID=A0A8I2YCI6_9AGAM|nr:hypothetical protein JVT61DRAFT_14919 [Boletus reticuloceps]